jgi:hypothetical protein
MTTPSEIENNYRLMTIDQVVAGTEKFPHLFDALKATINQEPPMDEHALIQLIERRGRQLLRDIKRGAPEHRAGLGTLVSVVMNTSRWLKGTLSEHRAHARFDAVARIIKLVHQGKPLPLVHQAQPLPMGKESKLL